MHPLLAIAAAAALLLYLVPAALLYGAQDDILFPAPSISPDQLARMARNAGAAEVYATTDDGVRLYGWHVRTPAPPPEGAGVLLYFHGNGESVAYTTDIQREVAGLGWDFVCVSPRGYPGSEGRPGAGSLAADARAAWRLVTEDLGYPPERVVLHGRSLGGGMVGTLLPRIPPPGGVVLESTFVSLVEMARGMAPIYPVRLLLRHEASTGDHAAGYARPVLVLHGDRDEVIPARHGQELARRFPQGRLIEVAGFGHNDNLLLRDAGAYAAWRDYLSESARSSASSPAN